MWSLPRTGLGAGLGGGGGGGAALDLGVGALGGGGIISSITGVGGTEKQKKKETEHK